MPSSYPTIQSFYQPELPASTSIPEPTSSQPSPPGDGFTESELLAAQDPLTRPWNPTREYTQLTISSLVPGPLPVTFNGRIVNLSTIRGTSQKEKSAAGWHYLLIKDDSSVISVKLYFAQTPYTLTLGLLLTIWTSFISEPSKNPTHNTPGVSLYANIFPGRVTSDHILIHTSESSPSICRAPLNYVKSQSLTGLMTLASYLAGGHDGVSGVKILVCVKSIGAEKKLARKQGGENILRDITLFDHTAEIRLTIWNELLPSIKSWKPNHTILLLSNPGFRVTPAGKGSLGLTKATMVEIDPEFADAGWLRDYAGRVRQKESLCLGFPEGVWDVEAAEGGVNRMFFTVGELDVWVRANPEQTFTGFVSVVIVEMDLVRLWRRNMVMYGECCGIQLFSNTPQTPCPTCKTTINLVLNPKIIGPHPMIDETGSIDSSKLLWSPRAFQTLLNTSLETLATLTLPHIQAIQDRLLGLRIHLVIGWAGTNSEAAIGRSAVLNVMY
ncbi:Nucleic acid-binding protein [Glarea lozoyensis ATCC 20868]|uniref:Nucleic acid-binding protein n=1 Tax=Glarea lozoyensis (strain ATCC 20868 / MF5171) TaxID=1116229 RepID=S3D5K0_GLAL2|nr:Nucleic acid-binding protein [Glarea lozoyensis ATCC 20868]EPE27351.1 Nucleic acid-binding protein [Glarea lozoyensis ATCC 20868]